MTSRGSETGALSSELAKKRGHINLRDKKNTAANGKIAQRRKSKEQSHPLPRDTEMLTSNCACILDGSVAAT